MTLKEIAELLEAKVLCGQDRLNEEHETAFASDLMNDVHIMKYLKEMIQENLKEIHYND